MELCPPELINIICIYTSNYNFTFVNTITNCIYNQNKIEILNGKLQTLYNCKVPKGMVMEVYNQFKDHSINNYNCKQLINKKYIHVAVYLLEKNQSIFGDQDVNTLFFARKGLLDGVKLYTEHGLQGEQLVCNCNKTTEKHYSGILAKSNIPLYYSAKNGHHNVVRYLLSKGAQTDILSRNMKMYYGIE